MRRVETSPHLICLCDEHFNSSKKNARYVSVLGRNGINLKNVLTYLLTTPPRKTMNIYIYICISYVLDLYQMI